MSEGNRTNEAQPTEEFLSGYNAGRYAGETKKPYDVHEAWATFRKNGGHRGESPKTVWHFMSSPGVALCRADYPNMSKTEVRANVTCTGCKSVYRDLAYQQSPSRPRVRRTGLCVVCGHKNEEPHTWEECAKLSRSFADQATIAACDLSEMNDRLRKVAEAARELRDWPSDAIPTRLWVALSDALDELTEAEASDCASKTSTPPSGVDSDGPNSESRLTSDAPEASASVVGAAGVPSASAAQERTSTGRTAGDPAFSFKEPVVLHKNTLGLNREMMAPAVERARKVLADSDSSGGARCAVCKGSGWVEWSIPDADGDTHGRPCDACPTAAADEERLRALWLEDWISEDAGTIRKLLALLAEVRAEEREACAEECRREADRCRIAMVNADGLQFSVARQAANMAALLERRTRARSTQALPKEK